MIKDGKVFMVTGSPGGSFISTVVLSVITKVIDYGFNIQDAVDYPRFHYQGLPNSIYLEQDSLLPDTIESLSQTGFNFNSQTLTWGASESILVDPTTGLFYGASDRRKPAGAALAF